MVLRPLGLILWRRLALATIAWFVMGTRLAAQPFPTGPNIAVRQGTVAAVTGTITSTSCPGTGCVQMTGLAGMGSLYWTQSGTYGSANLTSELSSDGTLFIPVACASADNLTSDTVTGVQTNLSQGWRCPITAGVTHFRVRATAIASGTVSIRITANAGPFARLFPVNAVFAKVCFPVSSPDVGLERDAAGVLKITNCAAAPSLRDLSLRALTFSGNILPSANNTYNIGSSALRVATGTAQTWSAVTLTVEAFGRLQIVEDGGIGSVKAGSPSNGVLTLWNQAETDFGRLQFGGRTSAFPALKRVTDELQVRLADDSALTILRGSTLAGEVSVVTPIAGDSGSAFRNRTSLATPSALSNGDWWVECSGASPSRVCKYQVFDGGATRTVASITY